MASGNDTKNQRRNPGFWRDSGHFCLAMTLRTKPNSVRAVVAAKANRIADGPATDQAIDSVTIAVKEMATDSVTAAAEMIATIAATAEIASPRVTT